MEKDAGLRLSDLIDSGAGWTASIDIRGITADSREVRPGYLFAALPGAVHDGRDYIDQAIRQGAVAVLSAPGTVSSRDDVPVVTDSNPRRRLALIAARFFGRQPQTVVAVTGTNGKTSVTDFTAQLWTRLGFSAATIGTLGVRSPVFEETLVHTTPDPVRLHRVLSELAGRGVDHVAMEASSHGLDQYRLDGVRLASAAFTSFSRDHLDYHPSDAAYLEAKMRLFTTVMAPGGTAVVNADMPEFASIAATCRAHGHKVLSYGSAGIDIRLEEVVPYTGGQLLRLAILGRSIEVRLPLIGRFQAENALAALGLLVATGAAVDVVAAGLETLSGVPGRLQHVATRRNGAPVFVDYAHTPDALEHVLTAARPHAAHRLLVVFGCGGDRDPGKRPMMGEVARRLADRVVVTDDNPRSEAAGTIRREILAGCPQAIEIGDRGAAIREAIGMLEKGDVLIVAGKGHEQGQIVGDVVHPFNDADAVRRALVELGDPDGLQETVSSDRARRT
jgi:UDP-N-acetylmuramoyl-L-alanyl-D-glutamate--2,6-diaminopimelate ligase